MSIPGLINDPVVFRMRADPEPQEAIGYLDSKSTMLQPNSGGPSRMELLELNGGMSQIVF